MSFKPKFLVTSAGGKTGSYVARTLLSQGYPVRALLRRDDGRAYALRKAGAEVLIGDQSTLAVLRKAMRGVQRAYHCPPTAANALHFTAAFAAAAQEAALEHIVTISQWFSSADHPSILTREIWLGTKILNNLPNTTMTEVNTGWFADNYFMVLPFIAQLGVLPMPLGEGSIKKNAPPSNEDIAAVVTGALLDPARHAGQVYRPTGPALLSPDEIAATMGEVLGRKIIYTDISQAMFHKALIALRPANYSEFMLTQLPHYAQEYALGTLAVGGPTDAVEDVTGKPAESFLEISQREMARRPEAERSIGRFLAALAGFMKIGLTPKPNLPAIEARRDHVIPAAPLYSSQDPNWLATHSSRIAPEFEPAPEATLAAE